METGCEDCHSGVPESTSLSDRLLPEKDDCASCHDVEDEEECSTCHYEDIFEPLIQRKSSLRYDHSFHLSEQNLECTECHQGLEKVAYSFESVSLYPAMEKCYTCHNNQTVASNACESCHISTANLIPDDHKFADFKKSHKFSLTDEDNCIMCHDNSFCETCHVGTTMLDVTNTALDFYTPYSPHNFKDDINQQQITRSHDLNYRYTHGIDAKGRTSECQTCHDTELFCSECHNSTGGDFALGGFVPVSHTVPNFTTLGVGSGGGEHALIAKRDIESCASCHDTQGADPNCILCHTDSDGIKGTNPRTHDTNFMQDIDGDWHSSDGSVCFNCHTDANANSNGTAGLGFCGYCHGSN